MNLNKYPQLETLWQEVERQLQAGESPEHIYQSVLGKKGSLTAVLRSLSSLPETERSGLGAAANAMKSLLEGKLLIPESVTGPVQVDSSVPALPLRQGGIHPISAMIYEMTTIFRDLSFEVVEGPELVHAKDNFENLNIGPDHPARDGQDSFYITDSIVLRTQMTAMQVLEMTRRMKDQEMPIRIVAPGKTYRRESDPTHSVMFHQMDAVMVDSQTTFTDLKGCLDFFVKRLFGDMVETRFRPHYFPFTEPSAEMDIRWKGETKGSGKHTGWLEFGGCGMIHPAVLQRAGINPRIYQGWAFGMAVERPIMIRKQVPDLRRLFENSVHLLSQFPENV